MLLDIPHEMGGSSLPTHAPPLRLKKQRTHHTVDQQWRRWLCLLDPPLRSISPRHGSCEACDSERSDHALRSTPTPSSSSAPDPSSACSSKHAARRGSERGKSGQGEDEDGARPVHEGAETVERSSGPKYRLITLQEPTTGSAFEDNLLSRTGLAPPLILELELTQNGQPLDASSELPFLICQCSLLDENGAVADLRHQPNPLPSGATLMPPSSPSKGRKGRRSNESRRGSSASAVSPRSSESTGGGSTPSSSATPGTEAPQQARMLYGTLVAGAQQYTSPEGEAKEKAYFFFPEISIRATGKYRIRCRLMRLPLPGIKADEGVLATVETQTFEIVKRSDYMAPYITDVSRHFARQGVPLLLPPGVSAD